MTNKQKQKIDKLKYICDLTGSGMQARTRASVLVKNVPWLISEVERLRDVLEVIASGSLRKEGCHAMAAGALDGSA